MLIQLLELIAVCWLPGAVLFRLPIGDRDRRARLDAEERLFWAIVISLAISLSVVLLLAAIGRYDFSRLLLVDSAIAAVSAAAARFRLRFGPAARGPRLSAMVPLVLALIGIWRFFPPSEYVIGGRDPGVYVNEGVQIAQRGALVIRDPVVEAVPRFARDLFFPSHLRTDYYSVRFMGFWIRSPDTGAVVAQFPHLFPASIAIGYGIDGLTGARRAVGVWAVLGVLAVYFAGARLAGKPAAAAAALLLALNVVQVWFARYPNAEVVMQALLFAAILASARAHLDADVFFAPIAALLLGLLLFLRFDAVIGVGGVLAGVALASLAGVRPRLSFSVVLFVLVSLAAAYMLGPMRAYAELPMVFISNLHWWQYAAIGAGAAAGLAALTIGARQLSIARVVWRFGPTALTAFVVLGAAYAYLLRQPAGRLAEHDAYALRMFTAFYLTLPALVAALIGFAIGARRAFWRDPALFLTVALFSFFFFYKIRIQPEHFWMARRFLPVVLPGALLFAGTAALGNREAKGCGARAVGWTIGAAFVGLLAIHYARISRPIVGHVEYAGIIHKLEELAGTLNDNDLLLVESRDTDTHVLALPLAYIYGRNVLVLASRRPDKPTFAAFLDWAHSRYARVLFMGGGGTDLLSRRWSVTPVASERFQVPEYDTPRNAYPRFVKRKEFDFSIYEFVPPTSGAENTWSDLDIGVRDDLHVLRFHAKEQTEGRTFRWSRDTSYISVTLRPTSREVTLWMNDGGRPAAAPPPDVTLYLDDKRLGTVRVSTGFNPYTFPIPAELAATLSASGEPVQLKLNTTVWIPQRMLGTADDRDLGVMVDRVAVR